MLPSTLFALLLCWQVNADTGCAIRQVQQEVVCQNGSDRLPPAKPMPMVLYSENLLGIAVVTEAEAEQERSVSSETSKRSAFGVDEDRAIREVLFSVKVPTESQEASTFADVGETPFDALTSPDNSSIDDPPRPISEKFHWKPAIKQSLLLLGIQHGYALLAQEKTRRTLKGPFLRDYFRSLKGLHGWDDGNRFFTNYVAHPMQGGLTGFIFVQNHDRAKRQKFAESPQYWKDRFKALVWSTAWSTQFELGPISQSSIGNLGMYGGMGYVDLVITPTVGTVWLVSEEAIDRYIIRHIEMKSDTLRILMRILLNPMRSVGNVLRFKEPWYRDRPFGH